MKYDLLNDILDDNEKAAIQIFYDNEVMREAVRKVLLAGVYYNGTLKKGVKPNPLTNFALGFVSNRGELPDEQLGAQLRSCWEGLNTLEVAFSTMAQFKKEEEPPKKVVNKAR